MNEHDFTGFAWYDVTPMTNRLLRHPFQIVTILLLLALIWAVLSYGQTVEAVQAMVRFTARISLFIFSLVFAASSLHRLFRSDFTAALLKNRRQFGVSFAYSHTAHLLTIIVFFKLSGNQPPMLSLIFGGLGYLLIYAMAFTSNNWSVNKLGAKNWKMLHKVGVFYIWSIFFITYLGRILPGKVDEPKPGGTKTEFAIAFLVVLAILSLRLAAAISAKARQPGKVVADREVIS
jgi:methionine sulfoxide reductase heme-binding subunit